MSLIDEIESTLTKYWEMGCLGHVNGGSELNPVDLWAKLRQRAHRFSFDQTVAFEHAHLEFAQNMLERRIFHLPYPAVIYEFAIHGSYNEGEDVKPGRQLVMIADVSEKRCQGTVARLLLPQLLTCWLQRGETVKVCHRTKPLTR